MFISFSLVMFNKNPTNKIFFKILNYNLLNHFNLKVRLFNHFTYLKIETFKC